MKTLRKGIASLLSVLLLFSLLPLSALAEDGTGENDTAVIVAEEIEDPAETEDPVSEEAGTKEMTPGQTEETPADHVPVAVTFVCVPEETEITVYHAGDTAEDRMALTPDSEGAYSLLPGDYIYCAACEGFEPVEDEPFTVVTDSDPMELRVTLRAAEVVALGESETGNAIESDYPSEDKFSDTDSSEERSNESVPEEMELAPGQGIMIPDKMLASSITTSGKCGQNLTWHLYKTESSILDYYRLTIVGTGPMYDWSSTSAVPWKSSSVNITEIIIGQGVTSIGNNAFSGQFFLESVSIPNSVTSIGNSAFLSCGSLKSIVLPTSLTRIGESAFVLSGLTSIFIPETVSSIGYLAFSSCSKLSSIEVSPSNNTFSSIDGALYSKDKKTLCIVPGGWVGSFTTPQTVTTIFSSAFMSCRGIKEIAISSGVSYIGQNAFSYCENLDKIIIPNSELSLGQSSFSGCKKLETAGPIGSGCNIEFGWKKKIPTRAFFGCSSLKKITIPDGITSIGLRAFAGCTGLTDISIPQTVTTISQYAFLGCEKLTDISLPNGLTTIEVAVFWECYGLKNVIIPQNVESIGVGAFSDCTQLRSITIPASVTSLGSQIVENSGVTEIYFEGNAPTFDSNTFRAITATAYYPTDDPTWTASVRQNYGGTITWIPVEMKTPAIVANRSLYLKGNVGLNFYLTLPDSFVADKGACAKINGTALPIPVKDGNGYYKFTYYVTAKEMRDDVVLQLFDGQGKPYPLQTGEGADCTGGYMFSAQAYFDLAHAKSTDQKLLTMLDRMSDYGMYAQVHFQHSVDKAVITSAMGTRLAGVTESVLAPYADSVTAANGAAISYAGATLMLKSETSIRHYFRLSSGSIGEYTFYVNGQAVMPVESSGRYMIEIKNIAAKDLDRVFTVQVKKGSQTLITLNNYSALSYVRRVVAAQGGGDQTILDLARSLYLYNQSAKAYFGN